MDRNIPEKPRRVLKFSVILYNYDATKTNLAEKDLTYMLSQDIFHNYHCDKVRVVSLQADGTAVEKEEEEV